MFASRMFKRNKLSLIRMLATLALLCVFVVLFKNIGTSSVDGGHESKSRSTETALDMTEALQDNDVPLLNTKRNSIAKSYIYSINSDLAIPPRLTKIVKRDAYGNLADLREAIKSFNREQQIHNLDQFPTRSSKSIVIVVQVHKRASYLIKLIESFRNSQGISDALLIFSHDYFSSEINNVIKDIDFCQVLQIFFPYSEQLYPEEFPGSDPNDCPRDTPKAQAKAIGCKNAEHPDMYGHYREWKFTMTKHHWWWKANRVFRELRSTRDHQGLVLFLEEDHYVAPDFYEGLKKAYMLKKSDNKCLEYGCDIITLGDYKKVSSFRDVGSEVLRIQPWKSTENNMGMAFDQQTWRKIGQCGKMFCTYDDYNWDFSLMKLSLTCLEKQLTVLLFVAPRVFHLGTCGLHHKDTSCSIVSVLSQVLDTIENSKHQLYPEKFEIETARPWHQGRITPPNGGWGDIRDHQLCQNFMESTD